MVYTDIITIAKEEGLSNYEDCMKAASFLRRVAFRMLSESVDKRNANGNSKIFQYFVEKNINNAYAASEIETKIFDLISEAERTGEIPKNQEIT